MKKIFKENYRVVIEPNYAVYFRGEEREEDQEGEEGREVQEVEEGPQEAQERIASREGVREEWHCRCF